MTAVGTVLVCGLSAMERWADAADDSGRRLVVEVSAGEFDRVNTPVFFTLPKTWSDQMQFTLTDQNQRRAVAVQRISDGDSAQVVWLLDKPLQAGRTRRYVLTADHSTGSGAAAVVCEDDGRHLLLRVGDRSVLRYNHAVRESPTGIEAHYRRSGYIHPLYTPAGREVTGDFPPDHAHQHGVFFPWVKTTFEDRHPDFWNQTAGTGRIEHVSVRQRVSGPVFGQFTVALRHSDLKAPAGPMPVLDETWTVRTYNLGDYFLVDFESRQRCVSDKPLTLNEYRYGGMAIRGNAQWFDPTQADQINQMVKARASPQALGQLSTPRDYLTSEGKSWIDGNATRVRWVEMHGKIDGAPVGVTVLGHPENFRAPQPVRLHPSKPYFCFAPMILGDFQIKPGEIYRSRYRYYVHDGPVDAKMSQRMWRDYATPPAVRMILDN